jgi:hypothetical protein
MMNIIKRNEINRVVYKSNFALFISKIESNNLYILVNSDSEKVNLNN